MKFWLASIAIVGSVYPADVAQWPQYRGPQGAGIAEIPGPVTIWSQTKPAMVQRRPARAFLTEHLGWNDLSQQF